MLRLTLYVVRGVFSFPPFGGIRRGLRVVFPLFSAFTGGRCPFDRLFYGLNSLKIQQVMATKIIVIDGYIEPYGYSKQFIRNELAGNAKNPVIAKISSLGGSVDDALNIFDQFVEHGNVTAELSAFVASSATLVSLGAKTVRMNENSFYLIHKAMNWVDEWGTMNEDEIDALIAKLEAQKQQLAKITLQLAKMYVKKTGKTLDEIINLMKQEIWLTAEEAKEWGFVDEVFVPEVAVNYLDNLQMVAMITGNGFPEPPRKNQPAPTNGGSVEGNKAFDEESLFIRIWNKILNKQQEVTPKNKVEMKKQFLNVNKVLNVQALEATEEGVFLNEEQLELVDNQIAQIDTLTSEHATALETVNAELATATSSLTAVTAERDAARTELTNALDPFNAIDPTIANAATPEAKVQAIRTLLAAKPGTAPAQNLGGTDPITDEVDWDAINNSELGKLASQL
jgi:ATP-dependent Clp protease, protease subunit